MVSALQCNNSRILTPAEADAIRTVISKPSSRKLFDLLLFTGLRLSEVKQLRDNPAIFDRDRRTIAIKSTKTEATQKGRNVCLSDIGVMAVEAYLTFPTVPSGPHVWQSNLIRWAKRAGLQPIPGKEHTANPAGITVRTTRKSWESWLLAARPDLFPFVVLSQGHNEMMAIKHYLNISFTQAEREAIKEKVVGWGCL